MGVFSSSAITNNGRQLLAHVQMGAVFTPTKIVMGGGSLTAGTTVRSISAVVEPVQTLSIRKKQRSNDGLVTIGGVYSNQEVTTSFYFRELGLYAKAVYADGTEVAEVLYSYGNAGSTADLMPAYSSGQPVEREIDIVTYIGNDTAVDLTISSNVYVTQKEMANFSAGGFVVIPTGEDIPVADRKEGFLYFRQKTGMSLAVSDELVLTFGGDSDG